MMWQGIVGVGIFMVFIIVVTTLAMIGFSYYDDENKN